jgi:hypothetical protein
LLMSHCDRLGDDSCSSAFVSQRLADAFLCHPRSLAIPVTNSLYASGRLPVA